MSNDRRLAGYLGISVELLLGLPSSIFSGLHDGDSFKVYGTFHNGGKLGGEMDFKSNYRGVGHEVRSGFQGHVMKKY